MKDLRKPTRKEKSRIGEATYTPLHLYERSPEEWVKVLDHLESYLQKNPNNLRIQSDILYVKNKLK
jgi:hypothetical protein